MSARCDFSDLMADQCACERCRPDVDDALLDGGLSVVAGRGALLDMPVFEPVGRLFEASYPSTCEPCGVSIRPGNLIARTTDGDWICRGCAA